MISQHLTEFFEKIFIFGQKSKHYTCHIDKSSIFVKFFFERKNLKKPQFWLKFEKISIIRIVLIYLQLSSIDKKANEYVHIVHIQCHLSVVNTMTLNNTGVFQCRSVMPVLF